MFWKYSPKIKACIKYMLVSKNIRAKEKNIIVINLLSDST